MKKCIYIKELSHHLRIEDGFNANNTDEHSNQSSRVYVVEDVTRESDVKWK